MLPLSIRLRLFFTSPAGSIASALLFGLALMLIWII